MHLISKIPQTTRVLLIGVIIPALTALTMAIYFGYHTREQAVNASIARAESLCDVAEATRVHMEQQWDHGILEPETIQKQVEENQGEPVLAVSPIIAALDALKHSSRSHDFDFRVPAFTARNPENAANAFQSAAIEQLRRTGKRSLVKLNHEQNSVHVFRPIRLTNTCLNCHGDPSQSKAYWGNDHGVDALGYKMEGYKEGDMYAAFEIIQPLQKAQQEAFAGFLKAAGAVALVLVLSSIFSIAVLRSIRADQANKAANVCTQVGDRVSKDTESVAAAIAQLSESVSDIAESATQASSDARNVVGLGRINASTQ